jgi:hypothetical protein
MNDESEEYSEDESNVMKFEGATSDQGHMFLEFLQSNLPVEYYSQKYLHKLGDFIDRKMLIDLVILPDNDYIFSENNVTTIAYTRIDSKLFYRSTLSIVEDKEYFRIEFIGDHCDIDKSLIINSKSVKFDPVDFEYIYHLEGNAGELRLPAIKEKDPDIVLEVENIEYSTLNIGNNSTLFEISDRVSYIAGHKISEQEAEDNMMIFRYQLCVSVYFKEAMYFNLKNITEGVASYVKRNGSDVYLSTIIPASIAHGGKGHEEFDKDLINGGNVYTGRTEFFPVKEFYIMSDCAFMRRVLKSIGG